MAADGDEITRADLDGVFAVMAERKRGLLLYFPATLDEWQDGPEEERYNSSSGQVYYIERSQRPTVADVMETLHGVEASDDDPAPSDRCARERRSVYYDEAPLGYWCDGSCEVLSVADIEQAMHALGIHDAR